jgi:hypothetical protein
MATAAMINNKVTTKDWFLGFTVPPNIIPQMIIPTWAFQE